jgi:NodT family efflux transporter outer membrane factor (OMF) lipoprotein
VLLDLFKKITMLSAVAILINGCASQDVAIEPLLLEPADAFTDQGLALANSEQRWWLQHNNDDLSTLIEQALVANQDLRAVYQRLQQSAALQSQAQAGRWLSVDIGVSDVIDLESGDSDYRVYGEANYEVDLWGRVAATIAESEGEYRASAFDYQTAAISLSAEVADAWYQWLEYRQQQKVLARQLQANEKTLTVVDLRFKSGAVNITDVTQQRQQVESSKAKLTRAEGNAVVAGYRLNILLGRSPTAVLEPPEQVDFSMATAPATGLPLELLAQRTDVQAAWAIIEAREASLAMAIKDRYPRIQLGYTGQTQSSSTAELFNDWLQQLTVNIVAPLIDGGQRRAEVSRQQARLRESVHRYNTTMLDAIAEVETALANERQQTVYVASVAKQKELAYFTLQRKRIYYNSGTTSYLDVLAAQTSAQELALNLVTAERQLVNYRISLYRSLAGGWPETETADSM